MGKKDKKEIEELVGICGIYCGTCPRYVAPRDQDIAYLEKSSSESGLPIEKIRCDGCLSDNVYPSCRDCRHGFRRCAEEHKVTWCFQCPDFPCDHVDNFPMPVGKAVILRSVPFRREHGDELWMADEEKRAHCPHCGAQTFRGARRCAQCKEPLVDEGG